MKHIQCYRFGRHQLRFHGEISEFIILEISQQKTGCSKKFQKMAIVHDICIADQVEPKLRSAIFFFAASFSLSRMAFR